jgi:hypothetical protein
VDGKPSILFGNNNNTFFISTKSGFNKNPIIYTSETEINSIVDKDLAYKLSCLFKVLKKDYNKIYQADVLWYDKNTFNNALVSPNSTADVLWYDKNTFNNALVSCMHRNAYNAF